MRINFGKLGFGDLRIGQSTTESFVEILASLQIIVSKAVQRAQLEVVIFGIQIIDDATRGTAIKGDVTNDQIQMTKGHVSIEFVAGLDLDFNDISRKIAHGLSNVQK